MTVRVLLADDHAVVRGGLRHVIDAQADLEVVAEAGTGREALEAAEDVAPDVVVMDIAMPELNGIEAAAILCERLPSVAVVILSMFATSEHIYRALEAGALGYLVKDAAVGEVVEAIRTVHVGRRYLGRKITEAVVDDYVRQRRSVDAGGPLARLSRRERQVLQLVVEGRSSTEIGKELNLSQRTVETYRSRIMAKLEVPNLPALIRFAIQHGVTPL